MPDLMRLDGLSALVEVSAGTYGAPVLSTDAVRVAQRVWSNMSIAYQYGHQRDGVASASAVPVANAVPSGPVVTLDIWVEMRGAGSDAVPELSDLYQCCGMLETDGTLDFTYTLQDASHKTASILAYAGGLSFPIRNCRGNFIWPVEAGTLGLGHFIIQGILNADPTAEAVATHTYDSTAPLPSTGLAVAIGGWSAVNMDLMSAEFDLGNEVVLVPSANAAAGIAEFGIPGKRPTFTVTARSKVGSYEPYAVLSAATPGALTMQYGSTQFNKVKLTSTALQIEPDGISHVDLDGFTGFEIKYAALDATILYD